MKHTPPERHSDHPSLQRGEHRWTGFVAGLALVLATAVAYSPVYDSGFIWDDDDYVHENPLLPASDGLARIWATSESPQYYPLVFTSYWIEYRLWGLFAGGYHLVNVLLHAVNALLVWRLLRRMSFGGAYVVAIIFALHPVHVESVAWITERKNVLSGLGYLLSMGCYLRFEAARRWRWYGGAFLFFAFGLLSKTVICTLPAALLLLRWWRGERIGARDVLLLLPFVAAGAAMGGVTAWYEHHYVLHGAYGAHWGLAMADRFIIAGHAIWFYTGKLLWPAGLVFNYPRWRIDPAEISQWLWPVSALTTAVVLWCGRKRFGRGLSAAAWFTVITLSPALGFVNVAPMRFSFVADHFQYLSSLGVIAAVIGLGGALIARLGGEGPNPRKQRLHQWVFVLTFLLIVTLGVRTYSQTLAYHDVEGLWRHTLQLNPASWLARANLGVLLRERGDLEEAEGHFEYMVAHCAGSPEPLAQAHTNLGHLQRFRGAVQAAVPHYELALELMPRNQEARFSLAVAWFALGAYATAEKEYRRYLAASPDDSRAHFNLALVLEAQGRWSSAKQHYLEALNCEPRFAQAHVKLAEMYRREGDVDEAAGQYVLAVGADPHSTDARLACAEFLMEIGRVDEALEVARAGLLLCAQCDRVQRFLALVEQRGTATRAETREPQ